MRFATFSGADPDWKERIERARKLLGAPGNPLLFPPHFLQTAFAKIGGRLVEASRDGEPVAFLFLFPRGLNDFTARVHWLPEIEGDAAALVREAGANLVPYAPTGPQSYPRSTVLETGGVEIGKPDEREAIAARRLQKEVWGMEDDSLYPFDLYSSDFRTATSFVARQGLEVIGFHFGFYKLGGGPLPDDWKDYADALRIESQVTGVRLDQRQQGLAFLMKKLQGLEAVRQGIPIVNWTVDPLQYPNARLNFGKLRAVSFRFLPGHYAFQNERNRTRASRLEISWLLPSEEAREALAAESPKARAADLDPEVVIVNDGYREVRLAETSLRIAIEIPGDWDALQASGSEEALRWRDATDEALAAYLGPEKGRYTITDVGRKDGRNYLIARRN